MIPYKPNRLYAIPQTLEKRLEIATAIRKLFEQDQDDVRKASPTIRNIPDGQPARPTAGAANFGRKAIVRA